MPRSATVCSTRPNNCFLMTRRKTVTPVLTGKNYGCKALPAVLVDCTGPISQIRRIVTIALTKCSTSGAKVEERSYFWKRMKQDFSELDSSAYQKALRKRQLWSEGTFAAQK